MRPKTAILADDHAFTLAGMVQTLQDSGTVTVMGTASNGIEAIALIKQTQPDCAILDYSMPGATGLEVMLEGRRWSRDTKFIVITGTPTRQSLRALIDGGINGLFTKATHPDEICNDIERILQGEDVICDKMQEMAQGGDTDMSLTARETEVLHAVARGQSNRQISESLGVSPKTVDSHRTSLMRKLGVNSTAALLVRAMKSGLIDVTSDI